MFQNMLKARISQVPCEVDWAEKIQGTFHRSRYQICAKITCSISYLFNSLCLPIHVLASLIILQDNKVVILEDLASKFKLKTQVSIFFKVSKQWWIYLNSIPNRERYIVKDLNWAGVSDMQFLLSQENIFLGKKNYQEMCSWVTANTISPN